MLKGLVHFRGLGPPRTDPGPSAEMRPGTSEACVAMSAEEHKVIQVNTICQIAKGCARVVAVSDPANHKFEYERETYRKRKLRALQITNLIADRFYFETALHSIIDLCVAANELDDARRMLGTISVDTIRKSILKAHPELG